MSYTPTNWSSGDIITATKLNKIEQGLSNTNIIANPTLAGTEADLEGLQVGNTKYKIGGGLPSYTNDDLGKSLKLADSGETTTGTVTTISEQTFEVNSRGEGSVVCAPEYPWILGETIHLTVNNEVHDCVVHVLEDKVRDILGISAELAGGGSMEIAWWAGDGDSHRSNVLCPEGGTFVVSATKEVSVPVAAPAWVSAGGGTLVVHADENSVLDKTWQEIHDAAKTSVVVLIDVMEGLGVFPFYLTQAASKNGAYAALFRGGPTGSLVTFVADSANGYPAYVELPTSDP